MTYILLAISFLASLTGSLSGGGSGLILMPSLLLLGIPYPVALCTYRIATVIWTFNSAIKNISILKNEVRLITILIIAGSIGSIIGTYLGMSMNPQIIKKFVGVLALTCMVFIMLKKEFGIEEKKETLGNKPTSIVIFLLGIYEGFFGAANGIFTTFTLCKLKGFNLKKSMAIFFVIGCIWCAISGIILLWNGHGNIKYIIPSAFGSFAGSSLGSFISKQISIVHLKNIFIFISGAVSISLLLF